MPELTLEQRLKATEDLVRFKVAQLQLKELELQQAKHEIDVLNKRLRRGVFYNLTWRIGKWLQ